MLKVGSKSDTVRAVQGILSQLGYRAIRELPGSNALVGEPLDQDGVFGPQTEAVVMDFQRDEGVLVDGVVGPRTMAALEAAFARRQVELYSPGVDAASVLDKESAAAAGVLEGTMPAGRIGFLRVAADRVPGFEEGYDALQLRADIAERYEAVRKEVNAQGASLTSSGGIRSLTAVVSEGRSATSLHYLGRALDLYLYSGMVDPAKDPYVIEMPEAGREALDWRAKGLALPADKAIAKAVAPPKRWHWIVWARCTDPAGGEERTIRRPITYKDRLGESTKPVKGRFLNLSEVFERHGFRPIAPRTRFFTFQGSMINAEWWHFQCEEGLVPGVSTFGGELLRVYSEARLRSTPPWEHRHKVFAREWS
jgi:peptidoglycan hydrolase-like protein with peptidoglycan-binding domain